MAIIPLNPTEQNNEVSWYKAGAAGVVSGILKVPEGIFSLASELIDLGADTNTAADVEQFFDKLNPFEEVAEERAIGKLTEALVQIGIPGTYGFKLGQRLASGAIKAKKAGKYANVGSKNTVEGMVKAERLNRKAGVKRFAAGVMGGAAGETFVADIEEIGSFGDIFEVGPTQLDRDEWDEPGSGDAARKLLNRVKFGSESILLTPFVFGATTAAKGLARQGKDLAYSNSEFLRWVDKYIGMPFRPRSGMTEEVAQSTWLKENLGSKDQLRAKQLVGNLTREINKIFPDIQLTFDKSLDKEKTQFLKQMNDLLFEGNIKEGTLDGKSLQKLFNSLKGKNISEASRNNMSRGLDAARKEFSDLLSLLEKNTAKEYKIGQTVRVGKETGKIVGQGFVNKTNKKFYNIETKSGQKIRVMDDQLNKLNADGVKLKNGVESIKEILKDRFTKYIGNTYRIYEDKGVLGFKQHRPTDEAMTNAINLFRRMIAKNNKVPFERAGTQYYQEAREIVDDLVKNVATARKQPGALPDLAYSLKTAEGQTLQEFEKYSFKGAKGKGSKVLRELFGEIQDPRYSIFNATTTLSAMGRMTNYLDDLFKTNKSIQAGGERGAFWGSRQEAMKATNNVLKPDDIVSLDPLMGRLTNFKDEVGTQLLNPFKGMYTTRAIRNALDNANGMTGGLAGVVRGRKDASSAEQMTMWLYRNMLLIPKATAQLAKTVLSVPTHIRNFLSAGAFAGANGILFEGIANPKMMKKAFSYALDTSGVAGLKGRKDAFEELYREGIEYGVFNTQVQMSDMKNLMRDVKWGADIGNTDAILRPMLARLKGIGSWAQGKYVAEDDFWKGATWFVERYRYKKAYQKAFDAGKISKMPTDTEIKGLTAKLVRNNVPNYAYVGDFVKNSRVLPFGNFMSFPSEMIRTTGNIAETAMIEMKHSKAVRGSDVSPVVYEIGKGFVKNDNPLYRIGAMRMAGMATTLTVVPTAVVEGAKALYDVTEDEIDALRRFVPEWSKNSTLVPIRDDKTGELKYMDFSHTNAYDIIARPFRTMFNNVNAGTEDGETILKSFVGGLDDVSAELMSPFIAESIWTQAMGDIVVRGGRTRDGRQLYTDQTSLGDKTKIRLQHAWKALQPGGLAQFTRLGQSLFELPTKRGKFLEGKTMGMNDEVLGLMGLRPITVDPIDAMGFKISGFQQGIRNARREFTGGFFGLLRGGPIDANDIIKRYLTSNKARFLAQKEMFKDLDAAAILGTNRNKLLSEFKERQISPVTFANLQRGKFMPYFPSRDIINRFREIAMNIGEPNAFAEARGELRNIERDYRSNFNLAEGYSTGGAVDGIKSEDAISEALPVLEAIRQDLDYLNLNDEWDLDVSDYIVEEQEEIITPPLPQEVTSAMPNPQTITQGQAMEGAQANLLASGLTPTEEALLTNEEKMMRRKQRGTIT